MAVSFDYSDIFKYSAKKVDLVASTLASSGGGFSVQVNIAEYRDEIERIKRVIPVLAKEVWENIQKAQPNADLAVRFSFDVINNDFSILRDLFHKKLGIELDINGKEVTAKLPAQGFHSSKPRCLRKFEGTWVSSYPQLDLMQRLAVLSLANNCIDAFNDGKSSVTCQPNDPEVITAVQNLLTSRLLYSELKGTTLEFSQFAKSDYQFRLDQTLREVAMTGSMQKVAGALSKGANPNAPDHLGKTAVFYLQHNPDLIYVLYNWGADFNVKSNDGTTPLQLAKEWAWINKGSFVKALEDCGAKE